MKLDTFQYQSKDKKWTIGSFPDLDSDNTLILVFAAPSFRQHPEPIIELSNHYPKSKMIGCSTAGEIAGSNIYDNSLSVAVIQFAKTPIKLISRQAVSDLGSFQAGKEIFLELNRDNLKGVFLLSDGLHINGSKLVNGLNAENTNGVVITGGLAADGSDFKATWTICNGKICSDMIVAVGLYGENIRIGHGSRGGWDIFGPERRVTRSKDNRLYELDNKPALALYKEYLGEKASELPASGLLFPLAIRKNKADAKIVRTILGVDEQANALIFAGDIPTGYLAQLMRANFERLITGASKAGELALEVNQNFQQDDSPRLLIAISCVGRRLLLGQRTEEETKTTLNIFSGNTQQIGFYAYGEISPYSYGSCDLHNQTMTLTSIYEEC